MQWQMGICPACGGVIAAKLTDDGHIANAYPSTIQEWSVEYVPEQVREDWEEAIKVYRVSAHRAAVVLCGRTLEAAADARNIANGTLQQRITRMLQDDLITTEFKAAMNYVRVIRNVGAHAGQKVTPETAEGTMRFTQQALRLLFEVPGELQRLTASPPEAGSADESPGDPES
jgi:hypothetical protein